ncbi:DUF2088 domain-containing protein [Bacillaceae bacterium Marseille-Q3522]|nr:DUF2088 domain-containing protein [Bacillaceae bacterium Marseille-Q3522]
MESLDLSKFPKIELPRFLKIKQHFNSEKVEDISSKVQIEMEPYLQNLAGKRIAVGVGSRGVANIAVITKTVVDKLKEAGALPFIIPAMGSHGGATPKGQAGMLASFGITEETMNVPIDASMEVEQIGEIAEGIPIFVCKSAIEADGIVIIPRIKPHTAFRGPIESGALKMLSIGLGKQIGADSIHMNGFDRFAELIPEAGRLIAEKTNVLFAVSVVENAFDETYKVEVLPKQDIIAMKREKNLLEESKKIMASIPFPKFDVLVIEEIGKNISGDGQDPNVTGLFFGKHMSGGPEFKKSVIFDVTKESNGNALGVGMADVTTRKLFDKTDFVYMYMNAFTSTEVATVKMPMVAATSEDALRMAVKMCNGVKPFQHKIVWIKNTLELSKIIISEPLLSEAKSLSHIEVLTDPFEMIFREGEPQNFL